MTGQAVDVVARETGAPLFRTDIQGLRAIAVALVVLYHAGVPALGGGYVGVDVFFVISGYLITSHLASSLTDTGRIGLRSFYARRIRRILPVSVFVLVVTLGASFVVLPILQMDLVVSEALATALYIPNVMFALRSTDYLADPSPSPYQQYWSLGVEEQFYLVWPVALLLVWWVARRRRALLLPLVGVVVAGSFVVCLIMMGRSQSYAFFLLPSRAWELGVGGLVALGTARWSAEVRAGRWRPSSPLTDRALVAGGWLGLLLVVVTAMTYSESTWFPGYAAAVPVLGTALVIGCGIAAPRAGPTSALSVGPAQHLGRLSYSVYLWHWPLLILGAAAVERELSLGGRLALVACAIPLSILSYRYIEQPFRTSRRLANRPGMTIAVALTSTFTLVVAILMASTVWEDRPLHAGPAEAAQPLTVPPVFVEQVPVNLSPSLRGADADLPVVYAQGCHLDWEQSEPQPCELGVVDSDRTMALFGDSHAAQWVPALEAYARDRGVRLETQTKRSCPSVDMPKDNEGNPFTACDDWREQVIDALNDAPPDLIVIANSRDHRPSAGGSALEAWNEGLERTLSALPEESQVVVIADTPLFDETPSFCLSGHLDDAEACARPRREALDEPWRDAEEQTALANGAAYVDLNRYLCSDVCGLIIGPYLLYRDRNHLSTTISTALAAPLGADLEASGVGWADP